MKVIQKEKTREVQEVDGRFGGRASGGLAITEVAHIGTGNEVLQFNIETTRNKEKGIPLFAVIYRTNGTIKEGKKKERWQR